jgi:hypothetical protein
MATTCSIESFVEQYMQSQHAEIVCPSYRLMEVLVDERMKQALGKDHLKLAFDVEALQECPDAELVTVGGAIWESVLSLAVERHTTSIRYSVADPRPPGRLSEMVATKLGVAHHNIIVEKIKCYFAPCIRFKLKTAFLSDEREEHLYHIWIDGFTGQPCSQYGQLPHIFHEPVATRLRPQLPHKELPQLLESALTELDMQTRTQRNTLNTKTLAQQDADIKQINSYFATMISEQERKLTRVRFAQDQEQTKNCQAKLEALLAQKHHHIDDIIQKHKVRCEATLLDAVWFMLPRWRIPVRIQGRNRLAVQSRTLWWDVLLKEFTPEVP